MYILCPLHLTLGILVWCLLVKEPTSKTAEKYFPVSLQYLVEFFTLDPANACSYFNFNRSNDKYANYTEHSNIPKNSQLSSSHKQNTLEARTL